LIWSRLVIQFDLGLDFSKNNLGIFVLLGFDLGLDFGKNKKQCTNLFLTHILPKRQCVDSLYLPNRQ